jgi:hypothetical protein
VLINDSTRAFLRTFLDAFAVWIDRTAVIGRPLAEAMTIP